RGGRPPCRASSANQLGIVRARAGVLRIAREEGNAAALALDLCSRTSLWRWQRAYERGGLAALAPERRGPRQRVFRHPAWVEQVVIAVRLHRGLLAFASPHERQQHRVLAVDVRHA